MAQLVNWYMYILDIHLLIVSPIVPREINDTKNILFAETTIPGLSNAPISAGGFGNRKVSFSLQIIRRNNLDGNVNLLKLYEILRHPTASIQDIFSQNSQFQQNPKVIYNFGIGSVPLVWFVTKCDFVHSGQFTNSIGNPKFSTMNIELTLDENHPTNLMEKTFRQFAAIVGSAQAVGSTVGLGNFSGRMF